MESSLISKTFSNDAFEIVVTVPSSPMIASFVFFKKTDEGSAFRIFRMTHTITIAKITPPVIRIFITRVLFSLFLLFFSPVFCCIAFSSANVQLHIPFYNKVSFLTSTIFSVIKERRSLVTVQKKDLNLFRFRPHFTIKYICALHFFNLDIFTGTFCLKQCQKLL